MSESFLRCLIWVVVLFLFELLLFKTSTALHFSFENSSFLFSFLLELGQIVGVRFSDSIFIESRHHFVVVSLRWVQQRLDVELGQNLFELFVTIVNDFWGDQCDIRFV